jgi:autotransporter-associated beta strand protein
MVLSNDITFTMGAASTASGEISGDYSLTKAGAGSFTLSAANTYTGDTNISAGTLILTGSLSTATDVVMTNAAVWNLQAAQTVASLSMASGNSITNTAGTSSLVVTGISEVAGTITTAGDQNYKGEVLLIGSSKFKSDNGRINFDGVINANESSKENPIDIDIEAQTGQVTFNGRVGAASSELYLFRLSSNPYNLSVKASEINIFADITTGKSQKYTGDIVVGSNANNGSTRTLLSLNPSVEITGKVDDLNSNTHTLIIKAVASPVVEGAPLPRPKITIDGPVGSVKPLYALEAITGFQVIRTQNGSAANLAIAGEVDVAGTIKDAFNMIGEIEIRDSVTTQQDQTYLANQIRIGGGIAKLVLTTEDGVINILSGKNFINQDLSGGVKADDGTQIAIKGKFSRETANSFRESGVRYESDPVGGYVDAALANIQSKTMDKVFLEREARVVVGAALKMKDGKISSFDESTGDSKSNASETLTINCMKDISEECQK